MHPSHGAAYAAPAERFQGGGGGVRQKGEARKVKVVMKERRGTGEKACSLATVFLCPQNRNLHLWYERRVK